MKAACNKTEDSFSFHFNEEEIETFSAKSIGGQKLYPIGSGSWIWEEVTEKLAS